MARKPAAAVQPAPEKVVQSEPTQPQYAHDLDRLGQLGERINRACRKSYAIVLGGSNPVGASGTVGIDYTLFDKLSDDGAAVAIAEAIAAKSERPSGIHAQTRKSERAVLRRDEAVGRYVARAGFGPSGFAEWLEAGKAFVAVSKKNNLPDSERIAAFTRGYSSGQTNMERQGENVSK
jgi:hypothetical protein